MTDIILGYLPLALAIGLGAGIGLNHDKGVTLKVFWSAGITAAAWACVYVGVTWIG